MIKNIALDLDECLLHSMIDPPDQSHICIKTPSFGTHYTIFRPCAKGVIDYCRQLVGVENVFVLTTSAKEYAEEINRQAKWGFPKEQIFSREDLKMHSWQTAYGGSAMHPCKFANRDNVLIDNLPPNYNFDKIDFWGIDLTRYLQVPEYYGANHRDAHFKKQVISFLSDMMGADKLQK